MNIFLYVKKFNICDFSKNALFKKFRTLYE